jgi:large subunit ribosomal protein L20
MTRVKRGNIAHQRRHKVLKSNRSFSGVHSRLFRQAKQQRMKALRSSFINRKKFQRTSRSLWIQRIQAGLRFEYMQVENLQKGGTMPTQYKYSAFMHKLKKNNILLNRKILSQLAIFDRKTFSELTQKT